MASKEQQKNRGFYDFQQPASKTVPPKASDPSKGDMNGMKNTEHRDLQQGDHNFNYKAKVTQSTNQFHDFGNKQAGLDFNGKQKDDSLSYLKDRNQKGQEVRNFSGGNYNSRLHTYNSGVTAYNSNPIREVYKPATSQHVPPEQAIVDTVIKRDESNMPGDQTKLGQQIRHSKKSKS